MPENTAGESNHWNLSDINKILEIYHWPLIFLVLGVVFFIFTVSYLSKAAKKNEVVFGSMDATASALVKCDIEGAVIVPGVYELPVGSRVVDLLAKAGGLSAYADRDWADKYLNRAAKISDGQKFYIPQANETNKDTGNTINLSSSKSVNALGLSNERINLNTASKDSLDTLPGVGPVTADKIIAGRPYQSIEELSGKKIISNSLYNKIKDMLTLY